MPTFTTDQINECLDQMYPDPLPRTDDLSVDLWLRNERHRSAVMALHLRRHDGDVAAYVRCDGGCS